MKTWGSNYYDKEEVKRDLRDNAIDQIIVIARGNGNAEERVNRIIGVVDLLCFVERKMKEDAGDAATT